MPPERRPDCVIGLGEARVVKSTPDQVQTLVAYGLGSCVAICLWDASAQVAGMAHVVLPGADPSGAPNPRFARSVLPALISLMRAQGGARAPHLLVARLVGGAQVLTLNALAGVARVGDANTTAVRDVLAQAGVKIAAQDLGGSVGRSVWFDPRDGGQIRVRTIGSSDRYL